jgi:hypothetical protein
MRILLALAGLVVVAGCMVGEPTPPPKRTSTLCEGVGGWSGSPQGRWVRRIVEEGGFNVFSETGSALVASSERYEFYIWAAEVPHPSRGMPNWRRMARVRGVPIYGDRNLWRSWRAQGFTFWVQGTAAPAAGRLAPIVDASLRVPFRDPCA